MDNTEGSAPKNWCFLTVVLEKALESSLDGKEIKPVNLKWNQPWILIGRTDAEPEAPVLWPPDAHSWLIGKDSDAEKYWGQKENRMTEDEMIGGWIISDGEWYHQFSGHELVQTPGDGNREGSLACCRPWGPKELDATWWLSNNNNSSFCFSICLPTYF